MEREVLIKTTGLTKQYGKFTALSDIHFTLHQGDIYGLIGKNGSGKTTLFKNIMGLSIPTRGEIEIMGSTHGKNLDNNRKNIGFLIGDSFYPTLNAEENLLYFSKLKGLNDRNNINELLSLMGLEGVKKPFKSYSLGMKQRLGIARALLGFPPVLILDEPINGLDPQGIADIRNIIKKMNEDRGITFLISSHILSEMDLLATRYGFIDHGHLLKEVAYEEVHEGVEKNLIIKVDFADKAIELLHNHFGLQPYAQIKSGEVEFRNVEVEPFEVAKLLVESGLKLNEIRKKEETLEQYYIELVGEAK